MSVTFAEYDGYGITKHYDAATLDKPDVAELAIQSICYFARHESVPAIDPDRIERLNVHSYPLDFDAAQYLQRVLNSRYIKVKSNQSMLTCLNLSISELGGDGITLFLSSHAVSCIRFVIKQAGDQAREAESRARSMPAPVYVPIMPRAGTSHTPYFLMEDRSVRDRIQRRINRIRCLKHTEITLCALLVLSLSYACYYCSDLASFDGSAALIVAASVTGIAAFYVLVRCKHVATEEVEPLCSKRC